MVEDASNKEKTNKEKEKDKKTNDKEKDKGEKEKGEKGEKGEKDKEREVLTATEQQDLEALFKSSELTITDIDELSSKLSNQLTRLELENVDGLIESETAVQDVINRLEEASQELGAVDIWLNYYNSQLTNMRQYIEHIEAKNNSMEIVTNNQKALLEELNNLITLLDMSETARQVLMQGDLATRQGLDQAIKAAAVLGKALTADIKPELSEMLAVKEQRKMMESLRVVFAKRLAAFMESVFTKLSEVALKAAKAPDAVDMPEHPELVHSKLMPYKPLVHWLAEIEPEKFQSLLNVYTKAMTKAYKKEIKYFFRSLHDGIIKENRDQKAYFTVTGKVPELPKAPTTGSPAPRKKRNNVKQRTIDRAFRYGLATVVETVVMAEQNFLQDFFRLPYRKGPPVTSADNAPMQIDTILGDLFDTMIPLFRDMINHADKMDNFYPLAMLVDADQYAADHEEGSNYSAFIIRALNDLQMLIKQLFNKFIDDQVQSIKATQITVKRCGILPYFLKFPHLVDHMEALRAGKEGRAALNSVIDTVYHKIVMSLFSWLESQGEKEREKFRAIAKLVNFHHFSTEIMKRKVPTLEQYVKNSYDSFINNLQYFANYLINRSFEPLVTYFKEMDDLLKTLPADDIQYQSSHSKQALTKLTEKFGSTALERGFAKAIKNVNKNLSGQTKLIEDVIDELESTFTTKYTHYEQLVSKCYKGHKLPVKSSDLESIFRAAKAKAGSH